MPTSSSNVNLLPGPNDALNRDVDVRGDVDCGDVDGFLVGLLSSSGASAGLLKLRDRSNTYSSGADADVIAVIAALEKVSKTSAPVGFGAWVATVTVGATRFHTVVIFNQIGVVVLGRFDGKWLDREISLLEFIIASSLKAVAGTVTDAYLVDALVDAVERQQMHLLFQPELDLRTGRLLAVEALLRWDAPSLAEQRREDIITLAEASGMMPTLGDWVFDSACDQLALWVTKLPAFDWSLRINVSALQLTDQFAERVEKRLRLGDIDANLLCIELTEHAELTDPAGLGSVLQRIRALGIKLALDDVGTGHNSLSRIKDTPLDILKIDRSFVTELDSHPFDHAIVQAIVLLGRELDLEVVAEGVETIAVARALLKAGCWRAQGHLLSEAVSAEKLAPLLAHGRLIDDNLPFGAW